MTHPLLIRPLEQTDCVTISRAFTAQGWNKPVTQYEHYFEQQSQGARTVFVAERENEFAGYVTTKTLA